MVQFGKVKYDRVYDLNIMGENLQDIHLKKGIDNKKSTTNIMRKFFH